MGAQLGFSLSKTKKSYNPILREPESLNAARVCGEIQLVLIAAPIELLGISIDPGSLQLTKWSLSKTIKKSLVDGRVIKFMPAQMHILDIDLLGAWSRKLGGKVEISFLF